MTTVAEPFSSVDPLRLRTCPQCEYALEGLPDEGMCPECGFAYDRSAVIVRCQGRDVSRLNTYVLGAVALLGGSAIVALLLLKPSFVAAFAQMMVMLAMCSALCAIAWVDRITSPRAGDWLLWLTDGGIGMQTEFDPDSILARIRKFAHTSMMPLSAAGGFIPLFVNAGPYRMIFLPIAVGFVLLMFWFQRAMQVKPAILASGARPPLYDWPTVSRIELTEKAGGQYRILATNSSWISKNRRIVDAAFIGPPELAKQLRERIARFRGLE